MYIKIKESKYSTSKINVKKAHDIKPQLQEIYQNSEGIKNVIMENKRYKDVGCRAIAIFRMINHILKQRGFIKEFISLQDFDTIADKGGEYNDCWVDDFNNPVYNVLSGYKFIDRINNMFNIKLKYNTIMQNDFEEKKAFIIQNLNENISLCVRMNNLTGNYTSHFVNIIGYAYNCRGDYFFKMKETYKGYNGYDDSYVSFNFPKYYEIVY